MKAKTLLGTIAGLLANSSCNNGRRTPCKSNLRQIWQQVVVTKHYRNYDYYYASRINRFHRSYTTFSFYSPVYTDWYWYTNQPATWGISIYAGGSWVRYGIYIWLPGILCRIWWIMKNHGWVMVDIMIIIRDMPTIHGMLLQDIM